jgi:uncharacterized protein (TIGR02466 family)
MKLSENLIPLFSKPIYMSKLHINKKEEQIIKEEINTLEFDPSPSSMTINTDVLNLKKLTFLKNKIIKSVNNYTKNVLKYKNNFLITTSWVTCTKINESSEAHYHSNSMLSGVFYIECDKKSDQISFENFNVSTWMLEPEEYNIYNSNIYYVNIKKNLLILFPSEVLHKIEKNKNEKERISLAFNLLPVGTIGIKDSKLTLINK